MVRDLLTPPPMICLPYFAMIDNSRRDFVPSKDDEDVASAFIEFLMEHAIFPQTAILRSNVQLIKLLIERWRPILSIGKVCRMPFPPPSPFYLSPVYFSVLLAIIPPSHFVVVNLQVLGV